MGNKTSSFKQKNEKDCRFKIWSTISKVVFFSNFIFNVDLDKFLECK